MSLESLDEEMNEAPNTPDQPHKPYHNINMCLNILFDMHVV
jgi:hypothetical protein